MTDFELLPRPERLEGEILWFVFQEGRLLVSTEGPLIPRVRLPVEAAVEEHYLGRLRGCHCIAVELPGDLPPPDGLEPGDLRRMLGLFDEHEFSMASRASQVLTWRRNHRFCSRCGARTHSHERDMAMICASCDYTQYPRITPCVIMLVTREREALLARSTRFRIPMFSCLAGFMEAGETAEQAVMREVLEETGLQVHNLRYHGSQSWPFPHSLMLGFRAEYLEGDLRVDEQELAEAHWFRPDALPMVPPRGSIARSLIEAWMAETAF